MDLYSSFVLEIPILTQQGLTDEALVLQWLEDNGYLVRPSSPFENIHEDIDAYIKKPDATGVLQNWTPISIKSSHKGAAFDHFGVEIDALMDRDGVLTWTGSSWFQNGKAKFYLVYQGEDLFAVSKLKLARLWEAGIVKPQAVRTLSYKTVQLQKARGHSHVDTKSAYFSRSELKKHGIMKRIGSIRREGVDTHA